MLAACRWQTACGCQHPPAGRHQPWSARSATWAFSSPCSTSTDCIWVGATPRASTSLLAAACASSTTPPACWVGLPCGNRRHAYASCVPALPPPNLRVPRPLRRRRQIRFTNPACLTISVTTSSDCPRNHRGPGWVRAWRRCCSHSPRTITSPRISPAVATPRRLSNPERSSGVLRFKLAARPRSISSARPSTSRRCPPLARIQSRKHYLSDVVVGATIGIIAGRAVTVGRGRATFAPVPLLTSGGAGINFVRVGGAR